MVHIVGTVNNSEHKKWLAIAHYTIGICILYMITQIGEKITFLT